MSVGQTVGVQSGHPPVSKAGNEYANYAALPRGNDLQTHNVCGNLVDESEFLRGHRKIKLYFAHKNDTKLLNRIPLS